MYVMEVFNSERYDFQRQKFTKQNSNASIPQRERRWSKTQMKHRWRSEDTKRSRFESSFRGRGYHSRSPPPDRHTETVPAYNRRSNIATVSPGPRRQRDYSPEGRHSTTRLSSTSPRRSPKNPRVPRSRFENDWTHSSGESSPPRLSKRRRTRSPSPAEREVFFTHRRRDSRSASQDKHDPRNNRGHSPVRGSRPQSRGTASEIDSYAAPIRHKDRTSFPTSRGRIQRSPSPLQRSPAPSHRQRTPSPPSRRFNDSPHTSGRGSPPRNTQLSNTKSYFEQKKGGRRNFRTSKTPSEAGDRDRDSMDGPQGGRGNYGNPNNMTRGRGSRPYNSNRGQHYGTSFSTPNSSYHGSPNSNSSYHGGRGGWDNASQRGSHYAQNPPYRQNNFPGAGQSQEEYFQSQQQSHNHHSYPNHQQRPYRGGRGGNRGNHYQQQNHDRRFSGPNSGDHPPSHRGRGGLYTNPQWPPSGPKRGGGPNRPATGANSIPPAPPLSHKGSRASMGSYDDVDRNRMTERDEVFDDRASLDELQQDPEQPKDASKFSFAFKPKPAPAPPSRPPPDLDAKIKQTPGPPETKPPPTQPKGKLYEKKNPKHFERRFDYEGPNRPPHYIPRHQQPASEVRGRSRSPPPKRQKQEPKPRPKLSPEMAASDSIYFRKPGNESVVGAGTYGKVFKAIHIYTKDEVALKKIRMEGERDGFPITACREIKLLQNLRHKHVVALQEVMVEKNECFMVFEYMSHDLTGLINHPTFKLTPAHKKDLGRQMFEGLEFLHRRGVMHRDIKAANLLVSAEGQLKYADFGLARFYTKSRKQDYTNRVITIWYRPPELLLGETQYTPAVDVWSAACVFMEMFTKKAIFPGEGGELSQLQKVYSILGTPTRNEWPGMIDLPWFELMQPSDRRKRVFESTYSSVLSSAALDLVKSIFNYDHNQRPTAEEALTHAYFTEEEPAPRQPYELSEVGGDWHEYESKAHRRENDRKEKERKKEEHMRDKEKRKAREAGLDVGVSESDVKKLRSEHESDAGREEPPPPPQDERAEDSDGDGSARMSMS